MAPDHLGVEGVRVLHVRVEGELASVLADVLLEARPVAALGAQPMARMPMRAWSAWTHLCGVMSAILMGSVLLHERKVIGWGFCKSLGFRP